MALSSPVRDTLAHLRIEGLSASYADRRVLTDVSFVVPAGARTALIGENGTGKSTLLHIIAGDRQADSGAVRAFRPGGAKVRMGLLRQEATVPADTSVGSVIETAVARIRAAARDVEQAGSLLAAGPDQEQELRFAAALETAELLDAWNIDTRIAKTLAGLGLRHVELSDDAAALSGGQQSRLALAALLLSAPDVLLLDEPTNHLDDAAAQHLVEELENWSAPVLFTSHDRAFLDDTATALVDLDPVPLLHADSGDLVQDGNGSGIGVTRFTGTYTDYLQARKDARARWEQQFADEQSRLKKLRASVTESQTVGRPERGPKTEARASKKFYSDRNAKVVARRFGDARSRLEELEGRQIRKPPQELSFTGIPLPGRTAAPEKTVVDAARIGLAGRLSAVSMSIRQGEQWLVTGSNGTGKSTLLQMIAGTLEPTTGALQRARGLRIGLLTQHADIPDPHKRGASRTLVRAYEDAIGSGRATAVPLTAFGLFASRDLQRPLGSVSRGQEQRLALAIVLAEMPDVLLLDEPTNHLSLLLVTQLEESLADYPGTVVIASHDRWLRRNWNRRTLQLQSQ